MDDFDKEFENSPEAFDKEFESSEDKSVLSGILSGLGGSLPTMDQLKSDALAVGSVASDVMDDVVDTGRGVAEGMLGGGLGEVAGGVTGLFQYGADKAGEALFGTSDDVDAQLEAQGFKVQGGDKPLSSYLREGIDTSEARIKESKERSPFLTTGGQLAGAVTAGSMLPGFGGAGAAKGTKNVLDILRDQGKVKAGLELLKRGGTSYAKMTPALAIEGLLGSEGKIIEGTGKDAELIGKDIASNLAFGLPAALGMTAASEIAVPLAKEGVQKAGKKIQEMIAERPFLRQLKKSFEYGEKGINPVAEKNALDTTLGKVSLAELDNVRVQGLMDEIFEADTKLGQLVGKSIEEATDAGKVIDITGPVNNAAKSLNKAYEIYEDIANNSRGKQIYTRIANRTGEAVSPVEVKALVDDIDAFIGRLGRTASPSGTELAIIDNLRNLRYNISEKLKSEIPAYKSAASRFEEFRRLVPETIMSGSVPREISDVYMGDLKNAPKKLYAYLGKLVKNATAGGSSSADTRTAFVQSMKAMQEFENKELARLASGEIKEAVMKRKASDYDKLIRDYADDARARMASETMEERTSTYKTITSAAGETGESGRAKLMFLSNVAGKISEPTSKYAKKLMELPAEKMTQYADRLDKIGLGHLGTALRNGVQAGDQQKIRAALFVAAQNPSARNAMEEE